MSRKLVSSIALVGSLAVSATCLPSQPVWADATTTRTTLVVTEQKVDQTAELQAGHKSVTQETKRATTPSIKAVNGVSSARVPVLPAIVAYVVSLIVRFGIPWVTRYAADAFRIVFTSQALRTLACRQLRAWGNGWGWSSHCRYT